MSLSPLVLETALQAWLPRAEADDFVAMAYVAIIQFLTDPSPESTSRDYANNWLRRAMASDDPEFLIALAEELVIGTAVHRDIRLAQNFLLRALSLSETKGSYALARFTVASDRKRCLSYLKRAADLGHIPSQQVMVFLQLPVKGFRRRLQALRHLPKFIVDVRSVLRKAAVREHWWRYRDVIPEREGGIYAELGEDRRCYFAWAKPLPIGTFAALLAKGHSDELARGAIQASDLLPKTVDEALHRPNVLPTSSNKIHSGPGVAVVRIAVGVGWLALSGWLLSHCVSMTATPSRTVRDPPSQATIEVAIHFKNGPGLFETLRPSDFGGISGERSIKLSGSPVRVGEPIRGVFLTLGDFDGSTGATSLSVLPFGWTDAAISLNVPDYAHCTEIGAFGQIAAVRICTHRKRD